MKVSIITATYNSSKTLKETLDSLNAQTYQDIEYIVIDGASSDNTLDVLKNSTTNISTLVSEPDKGIYDALNKGIELATGDIIGFLHSDDMFAYPDVIKEIVDKFQSTQCDAVYGDLEYVSKDNISNVIRLWKSGNYHHSKLKTGWMPPHPTFYMKREKYRQYGSFNLDFKIAADYDSLLRYLHGGKVSLEYISSVFIKMRVGGASNRSLSNVILKTKEDIKALKCNQLPWVKAVLWKNLSKIPQFFFRN
jgi:glycosyltransferase